MQRITTQFWWMNYNNRKWLWPHLHSKKVHSEDFLVGLPMFLIWIFIWSTEEEVMLFSLVYYCICNFPCHCCKSSVLCHCFKAMSLVWILPSKFLYREAQPWGPTPYPLIYCFSRKRYPFCILSIEKWCPFHIPCLELFIPFNCCKCTVI